ncbi:MAG: TonB-dependent receptor [Bacteroidota bacterium]
MYKAIISFLLFTLYPIAFFAQNQNCNCCIYGTVLDKELGNPIAFATVLIKSSEKYAITDEKGNFKIDNVCPETYVLVISSLGYVELTTQTQQYNSGQASNFYLTEDLTTLNEVTVNAEGKKEKGTQTISQIKLNKADINTLPTGTLGTSLSQVEGVSFAATGTNVQIPIIHGLSGNRVLVLNNDLKHGFQNWGSEHAPEIDINAVNNITVIKGAGGVRFGPEALSGVILIEPNPLLLNKELYGNVGIGLESNGRGGNTNFEIGRGTEKWSYFLNGSFTKIGDRFAPGVNLTDEEIANLQVSNLGPTEPRVNLTNTGKEEFAFSIGARHRVDDWDFKAYYSLVDQNLGLLFASFPDSGPALSRAFDSPVPLFIDSFSYDISSPREKTQHHLTKAEIDWFYADDAKFTFRAGAQLNKRQEFAIRTSSERSEQNPIIDLDLITYDYQLEWEHPDWKGLDGFVGFQYFTQNNDNNDGTFNIPFVPNYNTFRYGIFVVEKLNIGSNTLEAGIRYDIETNDVRGENNVTREIFRDRYTFSNFTASLGYQWRISNNSSFKTNVGSAFRTPNVAELFSFGQSGFYSLFGLLRIKTDENGDLNANEVILLADSDVEIETGYKLTNEFRTSNETDAHAITTYINYIENFVFDRPIGVTTRFSGPVVVQIVDQEDALFLGLDYTWKKEFSEKFNTTFGLSYLWSRNVGKNEPLIRQPPISTNILFEWIEKEFWIFDSCKFTLRPSYTFEQFQAPRVIPISEVIDESTELTLESEIFDFINPPDGYFLLDASWSFKKKNLEGGLAIQNALNTRYRNYLNDLRYFADELGINVLLTLNYKF